MKMKLSIEIDLHPVFDDDALTVSENMWGLEEEYPSLAALLADTSNDPKSITATIELSRNDIAVRHPWPHPH